MFRKLLPRNDEFFEFFERHASIAAQAANELLSFADTKFNPLDVFHRIKNLELEGDKVTHLCMETLHKTFITPIDRIDVYQLMSTMDDVIDEIEDIGRFIILYKLTNISGDALQLINLVIQSVQEMANATKELRRMKNTELMQAQFKKIHRLEHEADNALIDALSHLFDQEKDTLTIIKWKEVYEHLEHTTDICEDVANILEGIVLEYE